MTGYARANGAVPGATYSCEIKSVNSRGLDIRLRLPPGLDALESSLRQLIGKRLSRGSITCNISVERVGAGEELQINQLALATVLAALADLAGRIEAAPPTLDGILALKGVLEQKDHPLSPDDEEALGAAIVNSVAEALDNLVLSRRQEGGQISVVLSERVDEINALVNRAEHHPARSREAITARLRQQIASLSGDISVSEERLAQEALLLAIKADIREELDRLAAHIVTTRKLIGDGGAVGRRLDFVAQEFNREANTLCSKSNAVDLTAIGLDLKTAIDQLREQVQNIE